MDSILKNIVRVGKVSSVDSATASVRVAFEDRQGMVSYDLPVIVPWSMKNKFHYLPDVGEQVLCLFLPNGNAQGFCLGSFYSDTDMPPAADSGTLTIVTTGAVNIIATNNVNVTGDVIADGISLKNHTHGGVTPGGGNTGTPS
ncbi:hypothetical protein SCACP_21290 [Sporomusa carbonis]|uniref:phage baseplate assembly protein V n=1 Tax=Sporomusa carbonis TaxID=3076075 RepID=UPI003A76607D